MQRTWNANEHRQDHATRPHSLDPRVQHGWTEGQIAHDVGGVTALVPHGLHRNIVVDDRMRLRITGNAYLLERMSNRREVLEQTERTLIVADRVGVASWNEDSGDAVSGETADDFLQL